MRNNEFDTLQEIDLELNNKAKRMVMSILVGIRKLEKRTQESIMRSGGLSKSTMTKLESKENTVVTNDSLEKYARGLGIKYSIVAKYVDICMEELKSGNAIFSETTDRNRMLSFLMLCSGSEVTEEN